MPNRENIRAWVDALRSGRFEQGHDRLATRRDGEEFYCCLGVASVVACEAGVPLTMHWTSREDVAEEEDVGIFEGTDGVKDRSFLPISVQAWLGVGSAYPTVGWGTSRTPLSTINDEGVSFAEIADLIEAEWLTDAPDGGAS